MADMLRPPWGLVSSRLQGLPGQCLPVEVSGSESRLIRWLARPWPGSGRAEYLSIAKDWDEDNISPSQEGRVCRDGFFTPPRWGGEWPLASSLGFSLQQQETHPGGARPATQPGLHRCQSAQAVDTGGSADHQRYPRRTKQYVAHASPEARSKDHHSQVRLAKGRCCSAACLLALSSSSRARGASASPVCGSCWQHRVFVRLDGAGQRSTRLSRATV